MESGPEAVPRSWRCHTSSENRALVGLPAQRVNAAMGWRSETDVPRIFGPRHWSAFTNHGLLPGMAVSCLLALYSPLARWTNALCVPPSPRRAAPSTDVRLLRPSLPPDRAVAMPWLEPSRGGPNSLKMRDKEAREGPAMHAAQQLGRSRDRELAISQSLFSLLHCSPER